MTHLIVAGFAPASFKANTSITTISNGTLAAVCYRQDKNRSTMQTAIFHNELVNAVSNTTAFVPLRSEQLVGSREEVLRQMAGHSDQIAALLSRFGRTVEVSLFLETSKMAEPKSGKTYLAERSASLQAMRTLKEAVSREATKLTDGKFGVIEAKASSVNLGNISLRLDVAITKSSYGSATLSAIEKLVSVHCKINRIAGPFAPYTFGALDFKPEELAA
ncbi:MAG: GvpL/GvpF family gas vesicle protein [Rhizobiaceae bacterium]